jgi:DNA-binding CsgD family transcriptional regulator
VLRRRPGLGTLVDEASVLRARLAQQRGSGVPGALALTATELRLLPLLSTHLPLPDIAVQLVLSPHTIKSHVYSVYRKLDASTRTQAVSRARELGSWRADGRLGCSITTNRGMRNFGGHLSHTDGLYFTATVFSTVGFGDITAKTGTARLVARTRPPP